jgi:ectoine hydroxylase-related dioxygenase (phytanoyl-CoA dioxygenase family)
MFDALRQHIEEDGYAIAPDAVPEELLRELDQALDAGQAGIRNLLGVPAVRKLATSDLVRRLVGPVLGPNAFAVRGILFNKLPGANWKVPWHQDSAIAVRERKDVPGWGPWSVKDGLLHVRPPAEVLARMLAVRVHLDDCGGQDGPLRVLPGSHRHGLFKDSQILGWPKDGTITCAVRRGDAILMSPLLLHASSSAAEPANRRVIHIEFADDELPHGMRWHERVWDFGKGNVHREQMG